jgi:uncharacterized protein (DUF488 family)
MFYRRKVILSLLQAFEGKLSKISLQKLLFLFTNRQIKADYFFVPYHYGCYSFSANADLTAMVRHGQLTEDKIGFTKVESVDYIKTLTINDKRILADIKATFGKLSTQSLMKMTYLNYQYFAINSVKAKDILSEEQYQKVLQAKPINNATILYTIGYEGITLEEYLNKLIKNDVKVLVDVRCNALSMKFGFSKTQLNTFCSGLNIKYLHMPEVGIQSNQRQELKTQTDYDNLFKNYKKHNLKQTLVQQKQILDLLVEKKRIALTCFEANICQCHRKHLAEAITILPAWNYELKHI